jgi:hypothetical protein
LGEAERLLLLLEADTSFPVDMSRLCLWVAAVRSEVETFNWMANSEDRIVGTPWSDPADGGR